MAKDLEVVTEKLTHSEEELNNFTSDVTYDHYASARCEFGREIKLDFLGDDSLVTSIYEYCWARQLSGKFVV